MKPVYLFAPKETVPLEKHQAELALTRRQLVRKGFAWTAVATVLAGSGGYALGSGLGRTPSSPTTRDASDELAEFVKAQLKATPEPSNRTVIFGSIRGAWSGQREDPELRAAMLEQAELLIADPSFPNRRARAASLLQDMRASPEWTAFRKLRTQLTEVAR